MRGVKKTTNNKTVDNSNNKPGDTITQPSIDTTKVYSNDRFKDVTVKQLGEHEFRITGKGQIFEANFGWVIEDGHNELQQGHHSR